jgi:TRAP-type mannitol/chloroaromatic compound transport system permease small subunit
VNSLLTVTLLPLSRRIDGINEKIGRSAAWLILIAVLVSSINALIRYTLSIGSNAWLELQWYLFAAVFLLCSPWTLKANEHIRIDVVTGRFSPRVHAWIDIVGGVLFLLPMCTVILWAGIPFATEAMMSGEMSTNAGGLIVWPAKLLIPLGFTLLMAQGVSELIKRIAFLQGLIDGSEFEKAGHHGAVPDEAENALAASQSATH